MTASKKTVIYKVKERGIIMKWTPITTKEPEKSDDYICTIEITENGKTDRIVVECSYHDGWFILHDDTEYGDDGIMTRTSNWRGFWQPYSFVDDVRRNIACRLIAWMPVPTPYMGDIDGE